MFRRRMGFTALAFLLLVSLFAANFIYPASTHALVTPPPGGGGTFSVAATMIDAGEIGLIATGTVDVPGVGTLDIAPANGIYFDSNAVNDGSDWPIQVGQQYYHEGVSGATCPSQKHNSIITITGNNAGNITADFQIWLPETGTNTPNQCVNIDAAQYNLGLNDEPVTDLTTGGDIATFEGAEDVTCAGRAGCNGGYKGINLTGAASTTLFFEQSGGQIIEAGGDPGIPGFNGGGKYVYTQKADGNYVQTNPAPGVNTQCPDYIAPFAGGGNYVEAKYYSFGQNQAQPCGTPGQAYDILVLTETPAAYFASIGGGNTGSDTGAVGTAAPPDNCPIQNWALRWLVCPVVDAIDEAVSPINAYLANLLTIPTATFDTKANPGKAYFAAWGDFRDIAVSLIVIAALIMVIGESAGFDLLDAYSIRKILPRLLTGAIAMTLSWVICTFIIQLFNNLDNWLPDIILTPFQGLYNNGAALTPTGVLGTVENAGGATLFAGATIAAGTAALVILGIPAILTLLLSLFIAMIIAFVTLTIRTMIIILWLISAPVGIACYILPTTQKGFHFWRDAGISAFVAGLAIVTFIAAGQVIAIVAVTGKGAIPILAPVAIIVSYMSIGTAFRVAGGLIGSAAGAVHNAHGGMLGGLKKYRHGQAAQRGHKIRNGEEIYGNNNPLAKRLNPIIQGIGLAPKAIAQNPNIFNKRNYGKNGNYRSTIAGFTGNTESDEANEMREKNGTVKAVLGDDMKVWAIQETTSKGGEWARANIDERLTDNEAGVRQSLINHGFLANGGTDEELGVAVSQVMAAKRAGGNGKALLQAAVMAQAATGTGYGTDLGPIRRNAAGEIIAGGGRATEDGAAQMMDWVDLAYGDNVNGAANAIAKMRGEAVGSGRIDLGGAGFGDTMRSYATVKTARRARVDREAEIARDVRAGTMSAADAETERTAARNTEQQSYYEANDIILTSANEGNDANKKADGKPRSAGAMATQSARKMQRLMGQVDAASATLATAPAGVERENAQQALDQVQRLADQHLGAIMSEYDIVGHKSPLNQQAYANALMAVGPVNATNLREVPTEGLSILDLGRVRTNDEGATAIGPGPADPVTGLRPQIRVRDNRAFRETRRDYNTGAAPPGAGGPPP